MPRHTHFSKIQISAMNMGPVKDNELKGTGSIEVKIYTHQKYILQLKGLLPSLYSSRVFVVLLQFLQCMSNSHGLAAQTNGTGPALQAK